RSLVARGALPCRFIRRPRDFARPCVARASEVRADAAAGHRVTLKSLVLAAAVIAQAATPTGVPTQERGIEVATPGPHRVAPDVPLLAGAAPFKVVVHPGAPEPRATAEGGLSDLRLVSARDGRAVPYL